MQWGLFLLDDGVHKQLETIRSRFFWEADGLKRKYHMVRWEDLCTPKNQGVLAYNILKKMNLALITKWI